MFDIFYFYEDVSSEKIELTDTNLNFTGSSGGKDYEVHIEFFKNVKASAEESKYKVTPRSVQFYVLKEKDDDEFWPRLLKDKIKEKNQVKIDWDRYVDEDEEEDEGGFDLSGMEGKFYKTKNTAKSDFNQNSRFYRWYGYGWYARRNGWWNGRYGYGGTDEADERNGWRNARYVRNGNGWAWR